MRLLMTLKELMGATAVVISVASLIGTAPAFAVTISDQLVVFDQNGQIVDFATAFEGQVEGHINVIGTDLANNDLLNGFPPTALVEPGTGLVSDIFGVCQTCRDGEPGLAFVSDTTAPLDPTVAFGGPAGYPAIFLTETAGPFSATIYLRPEFQADHWTAQFTSDLDVTPLPAALPLFATGLGLMGLLAKRRKWKGLAAPAAA
jgi:hypothetical protein